MGKNNDIDWNGLLTLGSLFGNILQAGSINQKSIEIENLLGDREKLLQTISQFQKAVEMFRSKTMELENINRNLLEKNDSFESRIRELQNDLIQSNKEKEELFKQVSELVKEKQAQANHYAEELEKLLRERG